MQSQNRFPLSELATNLVKAGYASPTYAELYGLVLDGQLAAYATRERSRWYFAAGDLPAIAKHLQLRLAA